MSTAEVIFEKSRDLPDSLQSEVLHFVEYLLTRYEATREEQDWAGFSGSQLLAAYGTMDEVYDEE